MIVFVDPNHRGLVLPGFVVFEVLHSDVEDIAVGITDIVTRFNYAGEPVEMMDLTYEFTREIGRVYSDGRRVATK